MINVLRCLLSLGCAVVSMAGTRQGKSTITAQVGMELTVKCDLSLHTASTTYYT
jgi:hypothetical protein